MKKLVQKMNDQLLEKIIKALGGDKNQKYFDIDEEIQLTAKKVEKIVVNNYFLNLFLWRHFYLYIE